MATRPFEELSCRDAASGSRPSPSARLGAEQHGCVAVRRCRSTTSVRPPFNLLRAVATLITAGRSPTPPLGPTERQHLTAGEGLVPRRAVTRYGTPGSPVWPAPTTNSFTPLCAPLYQHGSADEATMMTGVSDRNLQCRAAPRANVCPAECVEHDQIGLGRGGWASVAICAAGHARATRRGTCGASARFPGRTGSTMMIPLARSSQTPGLYLTNMTVRGGRPGSASPRRCPPSPGIA